MSARGPVLVALRVGEALASEEARALSAEEMAWLSPRATARRREEFVAGRVAVKRAVAQLAGVAPGAVRVARGGAERYVGPPVISVVAAAAGPVHVSISHAGGWVVAAADRAPVGVDIVAADEALDGAFAREWFAPDELAAWQARCVAQGAAAGDAALVRRAAFAGKEAALKWLGLGLTVPAASVACVPAPGAAGGGRVVVAGEPAAREVALALALGPAYVCVLVSAAG